MSDKKKKKDKRNKLKSELTTVVFLKPIWTQGKAKKWLKEHNLKPIKKVDIVKSKSDSRVLQLRYRLTDNRKYKQFITKKLDNKILLIIGLY